jgi:hypothetical protein
MDKCVRADATNYEEGAAENLVRYLYPDKLPENCENSTWLDKGLSRLVRQFSWGFLLAMLSQVSW